MHYPQCHIHFKKNAHDTHFSCVIYPTLVLKFILYLRLKHSANTCSTHSIMFFFGLAKDFMKDLQQPFGTMPVCAEGCAFRGGVSL